MPSDSGKSRVVEILVRERSRFLNFVRRQIYELSSADAEDILSDVTYNLLSRGDAVDQVENLTAYIYRSLANRVVDQRRSTPAVVEIDKAEDQQSSPGIELKDERPLPDQQVEQGELRRQLHEALGKLTPRERAVWIATEIDEVSFRELAEEWDEPIGTLLSLKSRASSRLRTLLAEHRSTRRA